MDYHVEESCKKRLNDDLIGINHLKEPVGRHQVEKHVGEIIRFLHEYRWIMDSYLSDYFVLEHSKKLLPSWQSFLQKLSPPDLATLLDADSHDTRTVWPLSLLCYKACTHRLSLDRRLCCVDDVSLSRLLRMKHSSLKDSVDSEIEVRKTQEAGSGTDSSLCGEDIPSDTNLQRGKKADFFCGQYHELYHIYRKHVKPKKQHEIHQLGKVIRQLSEGCKCEQIIDIGAGLGHLSRLLTFGLGLKVTTVEATGGHAPKASTFDRQMDREIKKQKCRTDKVGAAQIDQSYDEGKEVRLPSHVVHWIEPTVSLQQFLNVLSPESDDHSDSRTAANSVRTDREKCSNDLGKSVDQRGGEDTGSRKRPVQSDFSGEIMLDAKTIPRERTFHQPCTSAGTYSNPANNSSFTEGQFVLCGLHACGNLTPTLLRLFVRCPQAVGVCSVGCCYMKLSCQSGCSDNEEVGYPMSEAVKAVEHHDLSYAACEMACHFVDTYTQRLRENGPNLVLHSYRAALQQIILEKDPNFQRGLAKITVKKAEQLSFERYAEIGLKKLGLDPCLSESQLSTAQGQVSRWRDVVAFYTVRLALAPVIETLILLDRQLYLWENGFDSVLLPVFDPSVSPRNFVLVAAKS